MCVLRTINKAQLIELLRSIYEDDNMKTLSSEYSMEDFCKELQNRNNR